MGFDIRYPIGLLFVVLAGIMLLFGLLSDPAIYARSLGYNINLDWGAVMLVFGLMMLALARRASAAKK